MICAYMKPWAEGILVRIDSMAMRARIAARSLLFAGAHETPPQSRSLESCNALVKITPSLCGLGLTSKSIV